MMDKKKIEKAIKSLLEAVGADLKRKEIKEKFESP